MFLRVLRYDVWQTAKPMLAAYAAALGFALLARLDIFSLTDMPLVYLIFFGTIGILIYRYRRTMFGAEATLMFSTTLSACAHIYERVLSIFLFSALTIAVTAIALVIQGETMGVMLLSLSTYHAVLLYFEVAFSLLFLTIQIAAILTLANLPRFRSMGGISVILFACIVFGLIALLSSLTEPLIQSYLIVSSTDGLYISDSYVHQSSVALSFNSLLWIVLSAPLSIVLMIKITQKKLLVV